jgi:hypothetical protein
VFWDKYFRYQQEVTWDEFAEAFTKLLLDYGKIHLDEDQLLFIKSMVDPDYRNIVKVAHFLIFQDTVILIENSSIGRSNRESSSSSNTSSRRPCLISQVN